MPDPEGTDLTDDEAAREAGLTYLAELLRESPDLLWNSGAFQVTVTDDTGLMLFVFDVGMTTSAAASVAGKGARRRSRDGPR